MCRLPAVLVAVAVLASCSGARPPIPPTHVVALPANEWGQFALDVYDSTGLLTEGRALEAAGQGAGDASVVARPELSEIGVAWVGGACSHRPILNIRGEVTDLQLEIVPSPAEFNLAPVACPAVGILFGATLTLAQPVEQAAVTITEIR